MMNIRNAIVGLGLSIVAGFTLAATEIRVHQERSSEAGFPAFFIELANQGLVADGETVAAKDMLRDVCWVKEVRPYCVEEGKVLVPSDQLAAGYQKRNGFGDRIKLVDYRLQAVKGGPGVWLPLPVVAGATPATTSAPAVVAQVPVVTPTPAADPKLVSMSAKLVDDWATAAKGWAESAKVTQVNTGDIVTQRTLINNLNGQIGQLKEQLAKGNPSQAVLNRLDELDRQVEVLQSQGGKGNFATVEQLQKLEATITGLGTAGSEFETRTIRSMRELLKQEVTRSQAAQAATDLKLGSLTVKQLAMEQKVDGLTEVAEGSKWSPWVMWSAFVLALLGVGGYFRNRSRIGRLAKENVAAATHAGSEAAKAVTDGFVKSQTEWAGKFEAKLAKKVQGLLNNHSTAVASHGHAAIAKAVDPINARLGVVEQDVAVLKGRRQVEFVNVDIRKVVDSLAKAGSRYPVQVKTPVDGMVYEVIIRRETDESDSAYELIGVCGDVKLLSGDEKLIHTVTGVKKSHVESTIYRAAAIEPKTGKCRLTIPVAERERLKVVSVLHDVVETQPADLAVA